MNLQFKFDGKAYECIGEGKEFQYTQFQFLLKEQDYVTLKNRIINQTKDFGVGVFLKEIK
jgi:hypothetical protein